MFFQPLVLKTAITTKIRVYWGYFPAPKVPQFFDPFSTRYFRIYFGLHISLHLSNFRKCFSIPPPPHPKYICFKCEFESKMREENTKRHMFRGVEPQESKVAFEPKFSKYLMLKGQIRGQGSHSNALFLLRKVEKSAFFR